MPGSLGIRSWVFITLPERVITCNTQLIKDSAQSLLWEVSCVYDTCAEIWTVSVPNEMAMVYLAHFVT